jgi:hypothetical protein
LGGYPRGRGAGDSDLPEPCKVWQAARMARTRKTTTVPENFDQIATLRIELVDSQPPIWRELEVPTSLTLLRVHDVVQIALGWADYHMWEFEIAGSFYGRPDEDEPEIKDASKVRLRDVLQGESTSLVYVYDFGDNWEHQIIVSNLHLADPELPYPRLVAGQMAGPPEGCGGLSGYYALLEARDDPDHPDHVEAVEILGDYDPTDIGDMVIAFGLGRMVRQHNAARARMKKAAAGDSSA